MQNAGLTPSFMTPSPSLHLHTEIKILFTLKGTNGVSLFRLLTDYELCSSKNYLVFGYCDESVYCAYEEYRVVPLDKFFSTNLLAGKSLDDQIQILLQRRLNDFEPANERRAGRKAAFGSRNQKMNLSISAPRAIQTHKI